MNRFLAAFLMAALLAAGAACGGGGGGGGDDGADGSRGGRTPSNLEGLITKTSGPGDEVNAVTLRTDDGKTYDISLDPTIDYGFDPALLESYRKMKQRVRFGVERRENRLYATLILAG